MVENENLRKQTLTGLARRLGKMPNDKKIIALEMSAALAGVSLRVSREFVEAVPKAAKILSAEDIKNWAEMGRRLAMGSSDVGAKFFADGVSDLKKVPGKARPLIFQICTRQLVLSSSIALETFNLIPVLAKEIGDDDLFTEILKLASEIANRSAKHSTDFLQKTPQVAASLKKFGEEKSKVAASVVALAAQFANRTGGMTADLWQILPVALEKLTAAQAIELTKKASEFLEFGGSVTLHFTSAGGEVMRRVGGAFEDWRQVLLQIAKGGNAILISFVRSSPQFFAQISVLQKGADVNETTRKVLRLVKKIAETDAESALAAFRSSANALKKVSLEQYEEWIATGLEKNKDESAKARKSYFALETRHSNQLLQEAQTGLPLESVQTVLRIYIEGLTGIEVEIAPLTAMPQESRIGDGKTIYLPSSINEFDSDDADFRLYKVLAAHGAGQIEFGTYEKDSPGLKAAFADLSAVYEATAAQTDAFSLAGYIEDVQKGERALSEEEIAREMKKARKKLPKNSDFKTVLGIFPEPSLAKKIFGTMENSRIDYRLRQSYRGLRKDLDLMQKFLREKRPFIFDLPIYQVPSELLFQITLCGGATDDAKKFYGQIVSEIESVIEKYLIMNNATVADSLMATSRVYNLFQNITAEQNASPEDSEENQDDNREYAYEDKNAAESVLESEVRREEKPKKNQDVRDLFNAWNSAMMTKANPKISGCGSVGAQRNARTAARIGRHGVRLRRMGQRFGGFSHELVSRHREKSPTGRPQFRRVGAFALSRADFFDSSSISTDEAGKSNEN